MGDAPVKRLERLKLDLAVGHRAVNTFRLTGTAGALFILADLVLELGKEGLGAGTLGCSASSHHEQFGLPYFQFSVCLSELMALRQSNLLGFGREGSRANIMV